MMRWHKSPDKILDPRVNQLTLAQRGVLLFLEEMLSGPGELTGSVSKIAGWISADRKTTKDTLDALAASGYYDIAIEDGGRQGVVYTIRLTPESPRANPKRPPESPLSYPQVAPTESRVDAGLPSASLNREEENKSREEETIPPNPQGEVANATPPSKEKKGGKSRVKKAPLPSWYESIWESSPKKTGQREALAEARRIEETSPELGEKIERSWHSYRAFVEAKDGGDFQFICKVATFLTEPWRWKDYDADRARLGLRALPGGKVDETPEDPAQKYAW